MHVTAGSTTSNIDAALPNGGVISGTVDDSSSHPLDGVDVEVLTTSGSLVAYGVTNSSGSYRPRRVFLPARTTCALRPAIMRRVALLRPAISTSVTRNVSGTGNVKDISGATAVHVTAGATTTGISANLASG